MIKTLARFVTGRKPEASNHVALTLPEGWEWAQAVDTKFRAVHTQSGKSAVWNGPFSQDELDCHIAHRAKEINRDRIFGECGGDWNTYRQRIAELGA